MRVDLLCSGLVPEEGVGHTRLDEPLGGLLEEADGREMREVTETLGILSTVPMVALASASTCS